MATDPIAYSMAALDKLQGKVTQKEIDNKTFFNTRYYVPAHNLVKRILANPQTDPDTALRSLGITDMDRARAASIRVRMEPKMNRMIAAMMEMAEKSDQKIEKKSGSGHPSWIPKSGEMPEKVKEMLGGNGKKQEPETPKHLQNGHSAAAETSQSGQHPHVQTPPHGETDLTERPQNTGMSGMDSISEEVPVTKEERDFANAVLAIETTIANVNNYRKSLAESSEEELRAIVRGLDGGYIAPSPGGDFVSNPNVVPSGRNMYSINVEATPSVAAWEKGVDLGRKLLAYYQKNHGGNYPAKVSFTLWSGSFIESEGTTIAQILYILGVEPVRDQFGRVLDIRLISESELERPRIDVVIQTSGQFRDVAASRLALLQKAIEMAASADDNGENFVASGKNRAEQVLLEKGFSPKDARELSTTRIFGGLMVCPEPVLLLWSKPGTAGKRRVR